MNVVISCHLDVHNWDVSIAAWSSCLLAQKGNGRDFIKESQLWLDLGQLTYTCEDAGTLHENMEAVWSHSTWVSKNVAVFGPELDAVTVSLVVLHGFGVSRTVVVSLRLDNHVLIRHYPIVFLTVLLALQRELIDRVCWGVPENNVCSWAVAWKCCTYHIFSGGHADHILNSFLFAPDTHNSANSIVWINNRAAIKWVESNEELSLLI